MVGWERWRPDVVLAQRQNRHCRISNLGDFTKQLGKDILIKDILTIFKDDRIENWEKIKNEIRILNLKKII